MSSDLPRTNGARGSSRNRWIKLRRRSQIIQSRPANRSFAAEQYRNLAVQVSESASPSAGRAFTLMVTSPEGGAGKTLTSLNLALTIARGGERRVLLLEADLWRPSLDEYLDLPPATRGLAQALEAGVSPEKLVLSVWAAGIDVLPAGDWGRADNLADDQRLRQLLDRLRDQYDVVIVDAPPMLLAAGRSIAGLVESAVLVVRARHSKKKAIEAALSILGPRKTLGIVLNAVRKSNLPHRYFSPYRYYQDSEGKKKRRTRKVATEARGKPADGDRPAQEPEEAADGAASTDPRPSGGAEPAPREKRRNLAWTAAAALLLVSLATAAYFLFDPRPGGEPPEPAPSRSDAPLAASPAPPPAREEPPSEGLEPSATERSAFAEVPAAPPSAPPDQTGESVWVGFPSGLRLREGPGTGHPELTALPFRSRLELLKQQGEWLRVRAGETVGWVFAAGTRKEPDFALEAEPVAESSPEESAQPTPDPVPASAVAEALEPAASESTAAEETPTDDLVATASATSAASGGDEAPEPAAAESTGAEDSRTDDLVATTPATSAASGGDEAPLAASPTPEEVSPPPPPPVETVAAPRVVSPRLLDVAQPAYPPLARRLKITGRVVVEVLVSEAGQVRSVEVVEEPEPDGGLTLAAVQAARAATFAPATRDGEPIEMPFTLEFRFQD